MHFFGETDFSAVDSAVTFRSTIAVVRNMLLHFVFVKQNATSCKDKYIKMSLQPNIETLSFICFEHRVSETDSAEFQEQ